MPLKCCFCRFGNTIKGLHLIGGGEKILLSASFSNWFDDDCALGFYCVSRIPGRRKEKQFLGKRHFHGRLGGRAAPVNTMSNVFFRVCVLSIACGKNNNGRRFWSTYPTTTSPTHKGANFIFRGSSLHHGPKGTRNSFLLVLTLKSNERCN